MSIVSRVVQSSGTSTTDATAEQWHIKSGKTAYIASGKVTGNAYTPAMMGYDGSTGYQSGGYTVPSATGATFVCRFKAAAYTGSLETKYLFQRRITSGAYLLNFFTHSSDYSTSTRRNKLAMAVQSSTGSLIARVFSSIEVMDDAVHGLFAEYNASAGTAVMRIDGQDVLDAANAEHVLTTGTLSTGAATLAVGGQTTGTNLWAGEIGFCGYRDVAGLSWSDFFYADGSPKAQAESGGWGGWGAQPLLWNEHGEMTNNLGSAGAMTSNGTIVVGKGGNT